MSFFFKDLLSGQPLDDDTIKVYAAGTTDLLPNISKLDGSALANPFTVSDGGGIGEWGFVPPLGSEYDIWWEEGAQYITKKQIYADGSILQAEPDTVEPGDAWIVDDQLKVKTATGTLIFDAFQLIAD